MARHNSISPREVRMSKKTYNKKLDEAMVKHELRKEFETRTLLEPNDYNLEERWPRWYSEIQSGTETAKTIVDAYIEKYDLDDVTITGFGS